MAAPAPTRDPARLKADLARHGYCIVDRLLDGGTIAAIRERVLEQAAAERARATERHDPTDPYGSRNQWVYMLLNKGSVLRALPFHPLVRELAAHVLGPAYLLSAFQAHIVHPDPAGRPMELHTDQWWLPVPEAAGGDYRRAGAITRASNAAGPPDRASDPIPPPAVINFLWMVTEFTEETGATRLVPGSHLSGRQPPPGTADPENTAVAEAPAGSAVMWEGRTWHGAGVNCGDAPRIGIATDFCGPQFRQLENYPVGLRPDVREAMSAEQLALLGFRPWSLYGMAGDPDVETIDPARDSIGELRP